MTPTLLVNYSASRVVREPHRRRRFEHRNGSVPVPAGLPIWSPEIRDALCAAIERDHPGLTLYGYCYADPNVCHMTGRPCPSREACSEAQSGCGGAL